MLNCNRESYMVTSAAENGAGGASPATSDPPMNEDGHVLKSRRGLLAAGLAVAVVGAIGVASTMNAGADQIPGDQDATQATVAAAADASDDATPEPPATLPWGGRPVRAHRGQAGMSSRTLADRGLQAAGDNKPHRDFAPKGLSTRTLPNSTPRDVQPPAPAPSASASSTTAPVTTGPTTTAPAPADPTTTAPTTSSATTAPPVQVTTPPANKTLLNAATTTDPTSAPPSSTSKDDGAKFLYAVGSQATTADGMYAGLDIKRPALKQGDYHTLAELSVQDGPKPNNVVEVGWNVDRAVNGDDDPHLFVYYWINGKGVCYNLCDGGGFVPYNNGIDAGDTLPVDNFKKFGIQYNDGAWWIAYDTTFVGYYPASLWTDQNAKFTQGSYFQAFGEVAAASWTPCTQMGSGTMAPDTAAARIATVTYVNGPAIPTLDERTQAIDADGKDRWTPADKYNIIPWTPKSFRYGGPGCS
jgi:hypothetical protein